MQYSDEGELQRGKQCGTTHVLTNGRAYDLKHSSKGNASTIIVYCLIRIIIIIIITVIKRNKVHHHHLNWFPGSANPYGYSGQVVL